MKHINALITIKILTIALFILLSNRVVAEPLFDSQGLSLSLGGNGVVGTSTSGSAAFGVNIGIAQTGNLILPFQVGARQLLSYNGINEQILASSTLFYNATLLTLFKKHVEVAAGFNFTVTYGNISALWTTAPEFGMRWWIAPKTALLWRVDYPYDLNHGRWLRTLDYFFGFQVSI